MSSVLKSGDGGDRLIMPDLCHLSSDSEGRRTDGVICCAVVQCPDDASCLDLGAHAVGHRKNAKGSGCGADALGEFCHHLVHLIGVDGGVIPTHPVCCLTEHPSDLSVCHAANELGPGVLALCILDASESGVVEELIVADPEGSVPSFVVCPTVHDVLCVCSFKV